MADRPILFSAPMVLALLREAREPDTGNTQAGRILAQPVVCDHKHWPDSPATEWTTPLLRYLGGGDAA